MNEIVYACRLVKVEGIRTGWQAYADGPVPGP